MNAVFSVRRETGWRRWRCLLLGGALLLLDGCATRYEFVVDAVREPCRGESLPAFTIVNGCPDAAAATWPFEKVAQDVRTALSSKGLFEATDGVAPGIEIEIDAGIEGPMSVLKTRPVHVESVSGAACGRDGEVIDAAGVAGSPQPPSVNTIRTETYLTTVYRKFLRVTARRADTANLTRTMRPLWSVVVTNEDASADLASYVPLMVAAAMDLLGADSGSVRRVVLTDGDGRVRFIKAGL